VQLEAGMVCNAVDTFLGVKTGQTYTRPRDGSTLVIQTGDIQLYQIPLLANVHYRLPLNGRLSAHVGAGVGLIVGDLSMDGTTVSCFNDESYSETSWNHTTEVVFAYQGTAGVRYALTDNLNLGLAIKFLGTTDQLWSQGASELKSGPTLTHSILASLIYEF
jgi:opacity protein-like surface antigen